MSVNEYVNSMLKSTKDTTVGLAMDMRFDLVDFIRKRLDETGDTQKKLAFRLKMKDSQLTRILNAESNVTLETVARIYYALGRRPAITERHTDTYALISDEVRPTGRNTITDHPTIIGIQVAQ